MALRPLGPLIALVLASCTGTLETVGGDSPGPDDQGGVDAGDGTDGAPTGGDPTPDPNCLPIGVANQSGEHNAGENCMAGGCHAAGGEGPTFTLGGTLFDSLAGTAAVRGATITLRDASNADLLLHSAQNGNFWTTQTVVFPLTTTASGCPDVRPMIATVAATGAGCNLAGCHAAGNRIHLP